jgi:ketosteroid isomerase-like protein
MTRSETPSPLQVLEQRNEALLANDMPAFADLFAADGVIEMPFAAGELPARLVGKDAIAAYATEVDRDGLRLEELHVRHTHRTDDPEVVILELTSIGRVTATGERFTVPCIQVFRIRDGKIVLFRDYVGHAFLPNLS